MTRANMRATDETHVHEEWHLVPPVQTRAWVKKKRAM
jgi:hypothetical protein